jgi:site-specific DNA-methyltransferase (adenine-specific)
MKFDVIIGNPPYHVRDGGYGPSAQPVYHKFVRLSKELNPRYLVMIIPARWYSRCKGLNRFREEMLRDNRIREIHDFMKASDIFPEVGISGGVCYFKWERDTPGECRVYNHYGEIVSKIERPLREPEEDIFIRLNEAVTILRKVRRLNEPSIKNIISPYQPFKIRTYYKGKTESFPGAVKLYQRGGIGWIRPEEIKRNIHWVDKHKIFVSKTSPLAGKAPYQVISVTIYGEPNSCCTETFIVFGPFDSKHEALNVLSYIQCKLFRFLVFLRKNSTDAARNVYSYVPIQDFSKPWTDEELYEKYGLTEDEIELIEKLIRPMNCCPSTLLTQTKSLYEF